MQPPSEGTPAVAGDRQLRAVPVLLQPIHSHTSHDHLRTHRARRTGAVSGGRVGVLGVKRGTSSRRRRTPRLGAPLYRRGATGGPRRRVSPPSGNRLNRELPFAANRTRSETQLTLWVKHTLRFNSSPQSIRGGFGSNLMIVTCPDVLVIPTSNTTSKTGMA